jgi:myo-inositol 2-dehydrogenase / D-chiro-inositol 1-dehydrogenase
MSGPKIAFVSTAHIHTRSFVENILQAQDGRSVCCVWDDVEERGRRYAESAHCRYEGDLASLIADPEVDGFIICAENTRHLPLLEQVLPAGKPVFCEKPLVTTAGELARVESLLRDHPVPLFCGYFQPFGGPMQAVAKLLREHAFGEVKRVRFRNAHHAAYGRWFDHPDLSWFTDPELAGGGAFMDLGTHAVHLLCSLFGPVSNVWATLANESGIYPKVDDTGVAHLVFENGILGTVEASWTQTGGIGGLEITGGEKALWHNGREYVIGKPGSDPEPIASGEEKPTRTDRLVAVIRGEVDSRELEADLQATLEAVRIMEAAYRANASAGWQRIVKEG